MQLILVVMKKEVLPLWRNLKSNDNYFVDCRVFLVKEYQ